MTDVNAVLAERGKRYGDFTDHARIAQAIQDAMRKEHNWNKLSDVQRQALTVIADKIARILSGDPNYDDNWIDIQGYAKLAQDRLINTVEKDCIVNEHSFQQRAGPYGSTWHTAVMEGYLRKANDL